MGCPYLNTALGPTDSSWYGLRKNCELFVQDTALLVLLVLNNLLSGKIANPLVYV